MKNSTIGQPEDSKGLGDVGESAGTDALISGVRKETVTRLASPGWGEVEGKEQQQGDQGRLGGGLGFERDEGCGGVRYDDMHGYHCLALLGGPKKARALLESIGKWGGLRRDSSTEKQIKRRN